MLKVFDCLRSLIAIKVFDCFEVFDCCISFSRHCRSQPSDFAFHFCISFHLALSLSAIRFCCDTSFDSMKRILNEKDLDPLTKSKDVAIHPLTK